MKSWMPMQLDPLQVIFLVQRVQPGAGFSISEFLNRHRRTRGFAVSRGWVGAQQIGDSRQRGEHVLVAVSRLYRLGRGNFQWPAVTRRRSPDIDGKWRQVGAWRWTGLGPRHRNVGGIRYHLSGGAWQNFDWTGSDIGLLLRHNGLQARRGRVSRCPPSECISD